MDGIGPVSTSGDDPGDSKGRNRKSVSVDVGAHKKSKSGADGLRPDSLEEADQILWYFEEMESRVSSLVKEICRKDGSYLNHMLSI